MRQLLNWNSKKLKQKNRYLVVVVVCGRRSVSRNPGAVHAHEGGSAGSAATASTEVAPGQRETGWGDPHRPICKVG